VTRWHRALPGAVLIGLWLSATAAAHAVIVSSTPKAGETVPGPDVNVRIVLNSRIDRARSSLRLRHRPEITATDRGLVLSLF
jgi:methionine-rich copper-binding protein CopC